MKAKTEINEDLIRNEKLEYYKNWRKNNKDKVKKHNQNFWNKRALKKHQIKNNSY